MKNNTVFDCEIIDIPKVHTNTGTISILENQNNFSFKVKRIYYLYDVPSGVERGGHAHIKLEQFIVAASGSFDIILDDSKRKRKISLNNPNKALYLIPGIWRTLENFSSGSICLVLASEIYHEEDYIRDYNKFISLKK